MFPAEILPVVAVVSNMVHFLFGLPILIAFLVFYAVPLRLTELVWFPLVVAVQFVLTLGLAMVLAALTVHFRDIKDLLSNLLTLWFFATPIIYPMSMLPTGGKVFMDLNPFAHLAISYQEILFYDGLRSLEVAAGAGVRRRGAVPVGLRAVRPAAGLVRRGGVRRASGIQKTCVRRQETEGSGGLRRTQKCCGSSSGALRLLARFA